MNLRIQTLTSRGFAIAAFAVFALFGYGCGSNDSTSLSARFDASATPQAARLVKILPLSSSGSSVTVQVVIYGPDTTLDMYSFDFDVKIGNTGLLHFMSGAAAAGNALIASTGQTIEVSASPDMSDPSLVEVHVHKSGGGAGNGIAGASAVVVDLTFTVTTSGTSTLSIAGAPAPAVTDQNGAAIGTISFDSASGAVTGTSTSTGGSRY
jgi:hypothetical protein